MTLQELKKDLVKKTPKNLYIFHGVEHGVIEVYIDGFSSQFEKVFVCDDFSTVRKRLQGRSLFQRGKELYIIRYDNSIISDDSIWKTLEEDLKKNNLYLILKYGELDQRTKFFKAMQDYIVQFDRMDDSVLKKHIKKKIDISDKACEYLIDVCERDYNRIMLEIDKLINAKESYNLKDADCFKMCYKANLFYEPPEDVVYSLIDSIMTRNVNLTYDLLYEFKRRGDNPIMVLSLLHNNVKQLLQIQELGNIKNKDEISGLTIYQVKNISKYLNRFDSYELVRFMKLIKYCDNGIKSGEVSPELVLDFIIVNII